MLPALTVFNVTYILAPYVVSTGEVVNVYGVAA
jgi:hypothetical protein